MKSLLRQAFVFALTVSLMTLSADLLLWGLYQGFAPEEHLVGSLKLHGALHLAVFTLTLVGAALGFWLLARGPIRSRRVVLTAVLYLVVSFFAALPVQMYGDLIGIALWLSVGSAGFAGVAGRLRGWQDG